MRIATEDVKLQKENQRVHFKNLQTPTLDESSQEIKNIKNHILAFDWPKSYRLAIYYPLKKEIDLKFLHQKYPYILYPQCDSNENLHFVFAKKETLFQKKSFFYEPCEKNLKTCSLKDVDVFFVPGVAFDRWGGRLGKGKGFYDRILSQSNPRSLKIGVTWSSKVEVHNFLPQEKTDVKMDVLVTEKYILWTQKYRGRV